MSQISQRKGCAQLLFYSLQKQAEPILDKAIPVAATV